VEENTQKEGNKLLGNQIVQLFSIAFCYSPRIFLVFSSFLFET